MMGKFVRAKPKKFQPEIPELIGVIMAPKWLQKRMEAVRQAPMPSLETVEIGFRSTENIRRLKP